MATTFTVDRNKWLVGNYGTDSYLQSDKRGYHGKMCCLGFYAKQVCGLKEKDIIGVETLVGADAMDEDLNDIPAPLVPFVELRGYRKGDTVFAEKVMEVNDDTDTSLAERERKLTALFATKGITVTFTGTYPARLLQKLKRDGW